LGQYAVRPGYEKYGAAAWFDGGFRLTEIQLSQTGNKTYTPNGNKQEWQHAKWVWKVSLSVATFLVDHLAHFQLRECSGMIKALRKLPEGHELRRLMLPFTYGVVQRGRAMNEYLRENGLYHRAFAFTYSELQRLIRDAMSDAPDPKQGQVTRKPVDQMRYRWKLFKKKIKLTKQLVDQIHGLYTDGYDFWTNTFNFVTKFTQAYYGSNPQDSSKLESDQYIQDFYAELMANWKFPSKFRLKKYNLVHILTHWISLTTVWNNHLNGAVSFDYSVDPDFTGLKILGNNATQNNIQNYAEYCCVALSKGWQHSDLMEKDVWLRVLENMPKAHQKDLSSKEFTAYFEGQMQTMAHKVRERNKKRAVPYNAMNPSNLQSSASL